MVAILACWVLFPLLLALLVQGAGRALELLAGRLLPVGVRLPCGLALLMALMDLCTRATATARLAVPLAIAVGAVGVVLSRPWKWRWPGWADPATAVAVFASYAAPVVLSGQATWAGYMKLDDTATWISLADRALSHGRSLAGLRPSTYSIYLSHYLTTGYPLGAFLPLGLGRALTGQDLPWLVDPWMAFMAAMLGLSLAYIARLALASRGTAPASERSEPARAGGSTDADRVAVTRRAAVASWQPVLIGIVAAQPALLYAYYLWGGMKEIAGAMLVAAFAAAAPLVLQAERRAVAVIRAAIPALVVVWALIVCLSSGGLVWVLPGGIIAVAALLAARFGVRGLWPRIGASGRQVAIAAAAALAVLAVGVFVVLRPGGFFQTFRSVLTGGTQLGNLVKPLSFLQVAGVWPTQDFRFTPSSQAATDITYVLIALVAVAAAAGVIVALRRLRAELVLYVSCAFIAAVVVFVIASPWVGAKALASASPALPLAALVGAAWLVARGPRWVGGVIGALVAVGIVWSNALGYHGVNLAPRQQFTELGQIGQMIAGQGPTLLPDYDTYAAQYFLRDAAADSASDLRARSDPLITGKPLPNGSDADIDEFKLSTLLAYRTLVVQASPLARRPPSPYSLIFHDKFWDVWQRPAQVNPPVAVLTPSVLLPGDTISCQSIVALARHPGAVSLVAALAPSPAASPVTSGAHPTRWTYANVLALDGAGTAHIPLQVARSGTYSVWLGGSVRAPVSISIDGPTVGTVRNLLNQPGQYVPFGNVTLGAPGTYIATLHYAGADLLPGSGGQPAIVGPYIVLDRQAPRPSLITVPKAKARELCGRELEWVEAVGS